MSKSLLFLFFLLLSSSVIAAESYDWVRPAGGINITYLNVTNQTVYLSNNSIFENITVTNSAVINSTKIGTTLQYWESGLLDLGGAGQYPMWRAYSDGALGNLGAFEPALIVGATGLEPYIQLVDIGTLSNVQIFWDAVNTRARINQVLYNTAGYMLDLAGYVRFGEDSMDRTVLINSQDVGYGSEFTVQQYDGINTFSYLPLFACNYMAGFLSGPGGCRIPAGNKMFFDGTSFTNYIGYDGFIGNFMFNEYNFTTLNKYSFWNYTDLLFSMNGTQAEMRIPFYGTNITGDTALLDSVIFNTSAIIPHREGQIHWDDYDKTLQIDSDIEGVSFDAAQDMIVRVVNKYGSTINKSQIVFINGVQGQRPTIDLAIANNESRAKIIGIVAENISNNNNGYVQTMGIHEGINTTAWTAGTMLYLSPTEPGLITSTIPQAPSYPLAIGQVLNSNINGSILLHINPSDRTVNTVFYNMSINNDLDVRGNLSNGRVPVCLLNGTNCPSAATSYSNITIQNDIIINKTAQLSFGNSTTYFLPLNGTQEGVGLYINGSVLNMTRRDLKMNGTITAITGFVGGTFSGTSIVGTTGTFTSTGTFGGAITHTSTAVENQSIQGLQIRSTRTANATNPEQNSPWLQFASQAFWGANKVINWTIFSDPNTGPSASALNFSFNNNVTIQMFGDGSMNVPQNISAKTATIGMGDIGFPHAVFVSNITQSCTSTSVRQNLTHNIIEHSTNITWDKLNGSRIYFNETGFYSIIPSIIIQASGVNKHIDVWFSKNGINIERSNTRYEVPLSGETILTVAFEDSFNKDDYVEIAWSCSDDAAMVLLATPAATSPTRPESPSVITMVNKKSAIR